MKLSENKIKYIENKLNGLRSKEMTKVLINNDLLLIIAILEPKYRHLGLIKFL